MTDFPHHFVDLSTDYPTFVCKAPPRSWCNTGCIERCDAWGEGFGCEHDQTDPLDYCKVQEWLSEMDGTSDPTQPLIPIEVVWHGDGYTWRVALKETNA